MTHERHPLILVVDDDEDIRIMLEMLLTAWGYRVVTADDGLRALDELRRGVRPALILLDLMLPGLDGVGLMDALANESSGHDVPILVVSGDRSACEKAKHERAVGCLVKPVEMATLRGAVERFAGAAG